MEIALNSSINRFSYVQSGSVLWNVEIGSFCSIARAVSIGLAAHPISMVSTSPVFYDDKVPLPHIFVEGSYFSESIPRTIVGSDVWIGEGVKILAGVTIGDGVIIGAGSVVTRNLPAYSVCVGVPCKPIRKRFSANCEKRIAASAWWNWSVDKLLNNVNFFHDPDIFADKFWQNENNLN